MDNNILNLESSSVPKMINRFTIFCFNKRIQVGNHLTQRLNGSSTFLMVRQYKITSCVIIKRESNISARFYAHCNRGFPSRLARENLLVKVPFPARSCELNERTSGNNRVRIDSSFSYVTLGETFINSLEVSINETRAN